MTQNSHPKIQENWQKENNLEKYVIEYPQFDSEGLHEPKYLTSKFIQQDSSRE